VTYLQGKKILLTGASSGIGAELARELARRGAHLGLLARREDKLEALAAEIRAAGGVACWARADVLDTAELNLACDRLENELGGADVMIANAGYGRPDPPHRFKPGAAIAMYDTNMLGMLRCFDWALPRFLARKSGHLVGVASLASYIGMPNSAAYCGSKAAMRVHLQSLRVSLASSGIAVTTICPGFVRSELTDLNQQSMPFFWETDRACRHIAKAIEKKRGEVMFPWQMAWMLRIASRLVPTPVVEYFLKKSAPKPKEAKQQPA
jgi:short-subunit dehydrogenase